MTSTVYFAPVEVGHKGDSIVSKVRHLFDIAGFGNFINEGDLTAIKLHFGERGNNSYISPVYVRQVVDKVRANGGKPFVTDTNTLYVGSRHNSIDHMITAIDHGFGYAVVGAPLVVADGLISDHYHEVQINKKRFKTVKVAGEIVAAQSMIVMSHFKGHATAGFGGAIKNLAMGCVPRSGKMDQHRSLQPIIDVEACSRCGACVEVCPLAAITYVETGPIINYELCVGCGECVSSCSATSMGFDWDSDLPSFMEGLTEHAFGAVLGKQGCVGYLNFLLQITPDCDCVAWSDSSIVPDVGILAGTDPVAIDTASLELVNQQTGIEGTRLARNLLPGEDKFKGVWEETNGGIQLTYGEEIGLGSSKYTLVEV
jgi:uncharacterized Fe-S center protein